MEPTTTPKLSSELDGKFKLVGIKPGTYVMPGNLKKVNFTTITLQEAEALHKAGCRYLEKIEKKDAAK